MLNNCNGALLSTLLDNGREKNEMTTDECKKLKS